VPKPYWEKTAKELQEATKEFDEEFVADNAKPLTPSMETRWKRAKLRLSPKNKKDARNRPPPGSNR
jgi:hypothetical protein